MAMMAAYGSGDPYLAFAVAAGFAPTGATKHTHPAVREMCKVCLGLAVPYGMGVDSLAVRLHQPPAYARALLAKHREAFSRYWEWSQACVDHAMLRGELHTVFGWRLHVRTGTRIGTIKNFLMQATGSEMLRLACCLATERGIAVCAPVHDALLVEGPAGEIENVVTETQAAMVEASRVVLDGFELRSDAKIVRHPDRYSDPRGVAMWETVLGLIAEVNAKMELEVADVEF